MSMLNGVSECWWLSSRCVVNWDAWSAAGTLLAVAVALAVGVIPEINRRRESYARALAQVHLTETSLETQLIHLGRAIAVSRVASFDYEARQSVLSEMQHFDPPVVAVLLNFAEHLGIEAFQVTARCAVDMQRVKALVSQFQSTPAAAIVRGGDWLSEYLVAAYLSMDDARLAYSKVLGREPQEMPDVPSQVKAVRARSR